MQAMIFCAGLGTRFKPWTEHHPKALAIVNGKSLLQRNIEYLQKYGIVDVIVNVHHFAAQIEQAVVDNNGWGSQVIISDERDEVLETGGGLLRAKQYFTPGESFITCNADVLTDIDLNQLIAFHQQQQALITLPVSNRASSRKLLFDGESRLCGWENTISGEKKIAYSTPFFEGFAYSCVPVFSYEVLEKTKLNGKFSLIDLYLELAAANKIIGWKHEGEKWVDVGKPERVAIAETMF